MSGQNLPAVRRRHARAVGTQFCFVGATEWARDALNVITAGREGIIVVTTLDIVLVIQKDSVGKLGKRLEQVDAAGWGSVLLAARGNN